MAAEIAERSIQDDISKIPDENASDNNIKQKTNRRKRTIDESQLRSEDEETEWSPMSLSPEFEDFSTDEGKIIKRSCL